MNTRTLTDTLDFTPAVGDMPLTGKQRALLAQAHALGRDRFAARAAQWDEAAAFPHANYDDLREGVAADGAGLLLISHHEADTLPCITHRLWLRGGRVARQEHRATA